MPITRKPDGWYWGSKGPFSTKAKAVAVGAAARANGFKESAMNMNKIAEFIGTLLHSATVTHFMHLQIEGVGSDAAHRALAAYYDGIVELTDSLAESIQGAFDIIIEPYPPTFGNPNVEPLEYMKSLRDYVTKSREELPQESEIQNEIDGIKTLINHTVYKLTRLK